MHCPGTLSRSANKWCQNTVFRIYSGVFLYTSTSSATSTMAAPQQPPATTTLRKAHFPALRHPRHTVRRAPRASPARHGQVRQLRNLRTITQQESYFPECTARLILPCLQGSRGSAERPGRSAFGHAVCAGQRARLWQPTPDGLRRSQRRAYLLCYRLTDRSNDASYGGDDWDDAGDNGDHGN